MNPHRAPNFRAIASLILAMAAGFAPTTSAAPPIDRSDVARWNDRSSPRKALETFFYAIYCYDLAPELIVNAIDCLDLEGVDTTTRERDAALMAHELNGIISRRSDVALYGVPEQTSGRRITLADDGEILIVLAEQPDGKWRFARETVERIPRMRARSLESQRVLQESRSKLAEGRTDPEATMRSFFRAALVKHDFAAASQYLDLSDMPAKLHSVHGPEQARKLLFVMQRCAFAFPQEFPCDPDGWRFIWHSNHRGRIMLDRVRMADGRDAWLFSRMTLDNLDALVEGFRDVPPDPRYARIGKVLDVAMLTNTQGTVAPPSHVAPGLGSPRAALRTFFEAMDELEFEDGQAQVVLSCLDLGEIAAGDRTSVGLRLAAKLRTILRPLNLDLQTISDSWEAEAVRLNPEGSRPLTLARQPDGAWRFDRQSVTHIPDLFNGLSPTERASLERRTPFSSAQHTMRTLITAAERGDMDLAAECLDLTDIPPGARSELGPGLAFKLEYVLARLGRIVVHEIPNEPDGPRHYVYRGSLGRIALAHNLDPSRPADWLVTPETVQQVDAMFQAVLARDGARPAAGRASNLPLALKIRASMPSGLLFPILGLAVYQWIGLAIVAASCVPVGWSFCRLIRLATRHLLDGSRFNLSCDFLASKLRPLGFQATVWVVYLQLPLLDLPIGVVGLALPTFKFLWVGLVAWTCLRLIDLGMAFYTNSEHQKVRNNLNDMIVPTALRCLKLAVLVTAACLEVSLIGNGEWLAKLLAGMGLIGLAASLAAQDTLKNFFGTLLLIGEHPFRMGDLIVVNGVEGTVESVGFRSTRVRTADDSLTTIPNSVIAGTSIENRGLRKTRRYRCLLSMPYGAPVDKMMEMRDSLRAVAGERPEIIRADKVEIHIYGLGDGVELLVNVNFWADSFRLEMEARDWLNREILQLAERLGIDIAPIRAVAERPEKAPAAAVSSAVPAPKFAAADRLRGRATPRPGT